MRVWYAWETTDELTVESVLGLGVGAAIGVEGHGEQLVVLTQLVVRRQVVEQEDFIWVFPDLGSQTLDLDVRL